MGPRHFSRGILVTVVPGSVTESLQWGRGISAAELIYYITRGGVIQQRASMGPRHFSRGIHLPRGARHHHTNASMGPRHFSRGIHLPRGARHHHTNASMGPRHFSRGIGPPPSRLKVDSKASMGPRHFSRGIQRRGGPGGARPAASMGPRHFSRGIPGMSKRAARRRRLQWGRGISAAELPGTPTSVILGCCFNGAAAFQPRNYAGAPHVRVLKEMLQWGRGISAAELHTRVVWAHWNHTLQWGRGISAAELPIPAVGLPPQTGASMGPRHFSRGIF